MSFLSFLLARKIFFSYFCNRLTRMEKYCLTDCIFNY